MVIGSHSCWRAWESFNIMYEDDEIELQESVIDGPGNPFNNLQIDSSNYALCIITDEIYWLSVNKTHTTLFFFLFNCHKTLCSCWRAWESFNVFNLLYTMWPININFAHGCTHGLVLHWFLAWEKIQFCSELSSRFFAQLIPSRLVLLVASFEKIVRELNTCLRESNLSRKQAIVHHQQQ